MSERKYPFVVNNSSDEKKVEAALASLDRMIELGKKAEMVKAALERNGFYDKAVVVADAPSEYGNKREKSKPFIRNVRFPKYYEVTRADIPVLDTLTLSLGTGHHSEYGGHKSIEHSLTLNGIGIVDRRSGLEQKELPPTRIGGLRVGKRAISFVVNNSAYLVTTRMKNLDSMISKIAESDAVDRVATACINVIIRREKDREMSQRGIDLYKHAQKWLVEDGHVLRMLEEVVRSLHVKWVMES